MASDALTLESSPTAPRLIHQNASERPSILGTFNDGGRDREAGQVPRSASYTYLPQVLDQSFPTAAASNPVTKRTFSEEVLTAHNNKHDGGPLRNGKLGSNPSRTNPTADEKVLRHRSAASHDNPKITISKFTLSSDGEGDNTSYEQKTAKEPPKREGRLQYKSRSFSGSLSNLAKKSWVSPSRSPSPNNREGEDSSKDDTYSTARSSVSSSSPRKSMLLRRNTDKSAKEGLTEVPRPVSRKSTLLSNKTKRSLSVFQKGPARDGSTFSRISAPAIPKSFSTDRLPSLVNSHSSSEKIPPVPRSLSSDRLQNTNHELPRKKDELWNVFRSLEGEYQK